MLGTPEAFDQYGGDETAMLDGPWAELGGVAPVLSTTRARTGTWSLRIFGTGPSSDTSYARKVCRVSHATQGVALAIWFDSLPAENNAAAIQFRDFANAEQVTIYFQSAGAVSAYRGGTLLGNSAVDVFVAGAWNHFEFKVTISDTVGAIEVRINEFTRLNLTGIDTKNTSLTEISQWVIGELSGSALTASHFYVDDVVPWDTDNTDPNNTVVDWVGDCKVGAHLPIADTAEADWAKSSGVTGYTLIDDTTVNDADYISTAADGDISDFDITALPGNVAEIIGYCALPRLLKTDAGTVLVAARLKVGTDITPNEEIPATTAATYWPFVSTVDPDTGVPYSNSVPPQLRLERVAP
jgi:hypothetical protein